MFLYRLRCYGLASLVGLVLLACAVGSLCASFLVVSLDREILCETRESLDCFETQPAFVHGGNGSTEMDVRPIPGNVERVVAYDGWNETPAPGTYVTLERWEGDEIAFVYVPPYGSRYKANGAPDRESPAAFTVLLGALAVALPVKIVRAAS